MKKEEAIGILKEMSGYASAMGQTKRHEALTMATESLLGGMHCPKCGGELILDSSMSLCDVYDNAEGDTEGIVDYYTCSKCGREYEICDPNKDERDGEYSDYWHGGHTDDRFTGAS